MLKRLVWRIATALAGPQRVTMGRGYLLVPRGVRVEWSDLPPDPTETDLGNNYNGTWLQAQAEIEASHAVLVRQNANGCRRTNGRI